MESPYIELKSYYCVEGEKTDDWKYCPKCSKQPKIWIFDNGRYAKCSCFERYKPGVSAKSIVEYRVKKLDILNDYDNELRDNWNKHIDILLRKNKIEKVIKT